MNGEDVDWASILLLGTANHVKKKLPPSAAADFESCFLAVLNQQKDHRAALFRFLLSWLPANSEFLQDPQHPIAVVHSLLTRGVENSASISAHELKVADRMLINSSNYQFDEIHAFLEVIWFYYLKQITQLINNPYRYNSLRITNACIFMLAILDVKLKDPTNFEAPERWQKIANKLMDSLTEDVTEAAK